jgi:hypothetical protein
MRIRARLALENDLFFAMTHLIEGDPHGPSYLVNRRAFYGPASSSGVSTPSGTLLTMATSMRMPASSAQLLELLALLVGGGRQLDERSSAARRA